MTIFPSRPKREAFWPRQTDLPPNSKRRRVVAPRQIIPNQTVVAQAKTDCELDSGNDVISCYPTQGVIIPQEEWASFVWNSRRPEITQFNEVDIFLFRADSQEQILHFPNITNPSNQAGLLRTQVNDTWFGAAGLSWSGSNLSFPYCWVIIRSDDTLDGSQISQATFTAVQTTVLDSVASSSSAAAAASSSSARAASLSSSLSSALESQNSGTVQHDSSTSSFPRWAIAVIVVLGFLAIAASCILVFFILRRLRRRRDKDSNRNSMGSASPMITRDIQDMIQTYDSPPLPTHTGITSGTGVSPLIPTGNLATDAASTTSDGGGPLSGADAAIIADAFRKKLRKPDFAVRSVDEGDSPDTTGERERETEAAGKVVLSRELAEEGRDIRYVSSSKGVKVESRPGET